MGRLAALSGPHCANDDHGDPDHPDHARWGREKDVRAHMGAVGLQSVRDRPLWYQHHGTGHHHWIPVH